MLLELLAVFAGCVCLGLLFWCLFGLILTPVFGRGMVTLLMTRNQGAELEQAVRAYGWLRDGKGKGAVLLIVDCGLDAQGLELALKLRDQWPWVCYCPRAALEDCLELLQDTV